MKSDICMTVCLHIVYSKLSIKSVRNAFEESVGSRLQKFAGGDSKELFQRFTSQFKDEYKDTMRIHHRSLRRLGLCTPYPNRWKSGSYPKQGSMSVCLYLYIGEDPFDRKAKEDIQPTLGSLLQKQAKSDQE